MLNNIHYKDIRDTVRLDRQMHASKTDGFKMKIPMQQSATKHLTKIMPCLMRKINKIKLVRKAVSRHTQ